MIEELISKIFCTRNCAHLAHWKSDSYAEHTALGEFYDSVIDIIDNFVEVYQGNYTKIKTVKLLSDCGDILEHLKADVVWIHKNYEDLCHSVTPLKNILDELLSCYLRTVYKLRFLK